MKKLLTLVLATAMVFSMVACGSQKQAKEESKEAISTNEKLKVLDPAGRTKLTLASFVLPPDLEDKIAEFNNSNSEYYIEVLDYSQYNTEKDFSAGRTKLNTDIIGGNTPDLIDCRQIPLDQYTNKGLLQDLNEFIDSDEEITKDSFVPGALNSLSTGDSIYRMSPSFTAISLYGKTSKIGDATSWNIKDLNELLKNNSDIKEPFINMPPAQVLHSLIMYSMDEYVDSKAGTSNFNSQEFITLLQTVKQVSNTAQSEYKETNEELLSDKGLLATMYLTGIEGFVKNHNELSGDMNLIGFPTQSGSGNIADFQVSFGVFADSLNKEGAWQFLKTFLDEEYQEEVAEFEIPVMQSAYNQLLEASDATEEQKEEYNQIINNMSKTAQLEKTIMNIITEESTHYFEGEASAEQVSETIQSRASIYLSENK